MGWPKTKLASLPIPQSEHFIPVVRPAARLLPQFSRLDYGQQHFLAAYGIHLFANDLFHLADHSQPQREKGIDSRGRPAHKPGPQHEFMTDDFGIRWRLSQ